MQKIFVWINKIYLLRREDRIEKNIPILLFVDKIAKTVYLFKKKSEKK